MSARDKRLEKAQMRVLFQVPFFAPGVAKLPVVWDDTIETACTSGENIRWNPEFFDKCKDQELVTVLCHEVAHCLLGHIWRAPGGPQVCDWDKWNQATDHAVNNMLTEFGEQVKAKNLADPFPFPDGQWCNDPAFRGLAEEVIYGRIPAKPPGGKGKGKGPGKPGTKGSGIGGIGPNPSATPDQAKKQKADWDNTLIQSVQAQKGRGTLPGSLSRFVDEMLSPTVPWYELVRQWLREQAADDWNWQAPNPYFDGADFIMPTLQSDRIGPIVFATDTSGSIDKTVYAHFGTEKQSCLDDLKPSRLVDIFCDTAINAVREYSPGETIDQSVKAGGGTDFRPVFDHIEKMGERPKCLVYLTDLDGTFPDKDPGYPVLWVTYGTEEQAPFGETVKAS